jgi:hypothetical protein
MEVFEDLPIGVAVINDEQFAAGLTGSVRHRERPSTCLEIKKACGRINSY